MTELALRDAVIDVRTGEVLTLADAPLADLARWLEAIREQEAVVREQKLAVAAEFHRRMDANVAWTLEADGYKIKGEPPTRVTYNAERLHNELALLVAEGVIPQRAMDDAVVRTAHYTARAAGINNLKKIGGQAGDVVAACADPIDPARRRITLSRA